MPCPAKPAEKRPLSRRRKVLFACIPSLLVFGLAYAGSILYRARPVYDRLKQPAHGFSTHLHEPHPLLGGVPAPKLLAEQLFPQGPPMPLRHDDKGFRIPTSGPVGEERPQRIAFFGCSHTYGQGVPAEKTYANLAAEALDAQPINAGVCGAGFSHMLGRARAVLPAEKPDIIVVQYSPWLADRAVRQFAPNHFQKVPVVYFTANEGGLDLAAPVFLPYRHSFSEFRNTPSGVGEFCRFLFGQALPTFVHDDLAMSSYHIRQLTGSIPPLETDKRKVAAATFSEIAAIANAQGARMVVLVLGWQLARIPSPTDLVPPGIPIVHGHEAMIAALEDAPVRLEIRYGAEYYQMRGDPPQVVDTGHPNAKAHAVIATALVAGIRASE